MSVVMPFRLYTQTELHLIEEHLQASTRQWLAGWGRLDVAALQVAATPVSLADVEVEHWQLAVAGQPALRAGDDWTALLSLACLGQEISTAMAAGSGLARPVLATALGAWVAEICSLDIPCIYADATLPGTKLASSYTAIGAVMVEVRYHHLSVVMVLPPVLVAAILPIPAAQPGLLSLALSQLGLQDVVGLAIHARATSVALEEVASIRPGDVIRLDHRVGEPFELRLEQGAVLGEVELGHADEHLAVKIISGARKGPVKRNPA